MSRGFSTCPRCGQIHNTAYCRCNDLNWEFSLTITVANWVILAICEHIGAEETVGVGGSEGIRIDKPAVGEVIIAALEVVETGLGVVVIAAVAQGVEVADRRVAAVVHRAVAPCIIVVGCSDLAARIEDGGHVTLCVNKVIVQLRLRPVLVDHGERLVAVVVDKLKRFAVPLLTHDLAGERRVIVRRAVDRFAGADAGHVVGVLHGLAVHDGFCKLTPLRPREGIVLAVVICDRVAGGREVARLRLPLIQDILGRAVRRHAREQIRPRGVRVAEGLYDRAVGRDAADVAHRVVGVGAGHAAVGLGRKLALCVVGIFLRRGRCGHVFNDALHC